MSSNGYWRPVDPPSDESIGDALKFILRKHYCDDGHLETYLTKNAIPFLEGVCASTPNGDIKEDAQILIAAIRKHGEIHVWEQHG